MPRKCLEYQMERNKWLVCVNGFMVKLDDGQKVEILEIIDKECRGELEWGEMVSRIKKIIAAR